MRTLGTRGIECWVGVALSDVGREDRLGLLYITMLSLVMYLIAVRCYHLFYLTAHMDVNVVDIAQWCDCLTSTSVFPNEVHDTVILRDHLEGEDPGAVIYDNSQQN